MTKRRLIDTNLIVRHLVQDHEKQARIAGKLFEACDRGEIILVILPAVLAECVFYWSRSISIGGLTSPPRSPNSFRARGLS